MVPFERLLNQPNDELELLLEMAEAVQANYLSLKPFYYLKLKKLENRMSEIIWIKAFNTRADLCAESLSTEFGQARIEITTDDEYPYVIINGFYYLGSVAVYRRGVGMPTVMPTRFNVETQKQPSIANVLKSLRSLLVALGRQPPKKIGSA
jgi:hypothetical protein